ncbi:ATP/GTP-binding protein [Kocuria dechangensis]|uniref:ATP/GTP-binding protein n=1 Tax=Kocuria dechangensis TaxID=1176249 RepID=A0A917H3D1_9MICC|nr:VCBS repeat-containing protein [Kocuria dechangensis]GGG66301.1 ATP/GTP-binding protein [Kocuria dechangensis]
MSSVALVAAGIVLGGPARAVSSPGQEPPPLATAGNYSLPAYSEAQGWRVDRHPRLLGDVNGDRRADIVGFANDGVYVSYGQINGTVSVPLKKVDEFGVNQGWRVDQHPRLLGDVNGDGRADIVGFASEGTYVSYGQANNTFTPAARKIDEFGANQGWRVDQHPRLLGDVNGDGQADVVGFASEGTYVSYGRPNSTFSAVARKVDEFGANQGWRVDQHPRLLGDVNGDRRADVVGFASEGTYVSYGQANNTMTPAARKVDEFGVNQGWRVDQHPRLLGDINGDRRADVVGFANIGVYVSYGQANNTLGAPTKVLNTYGYNSGWRVQRHLRLIGDIDGNRREDIVGFGSSRTYIHTF